MNRGQAKPKRAHHGSTAQAWARALQMTTPIVQHPDRVFPKIIQERAVEFGDSPALLSDGESLTYTALAARANQYARWALAHGVAKGDCVGLFMPNRPEFMAIWLGISQVGGVVALLNTSLTARSLAHCINIAAPRHLIVAAELADLMTTALPELTTPATVWIHGARSGSFPRLDREIESYSADALSEAERRPLTIEDRALYIYTSGSTGLPKAAAVSHARLMQWSHWFAGMMDTQPADRMYNCLPMYHSVGGVQVPGAILVRGGAVVLRRKFSAIHFWSDIVRWRCTAFQYIGELCRYLLHTKASPHEAEHHIRVACGNGLRADIWKEFKNRFRIPQILEFYASTEGNVALFNVEGEHGAIGRIPPYLAHRFPSTIVKLDRETGEPVRDHQGRYIRCAPGEVGEAIGQILNDRSNIGSRFEGYANREDSEQKILRGAFQPEDAWFRTGDLMRKDPRGFFYFVDRIGDTFRWKGENVSTLEVSETLCDFPGIQEAMVWGVAIPGSDGRAGMAALVPDRALDLTALRSHLVSRLPEYAHPLFLRVLNEMHLTSTFKYTKTDLMRQGYDPAVTKDAIYFNHPEYQTYIRLDQPLYDGIQSGRVSHRHRRSNRATENCEADHVS